ncbi:hypothetical protein [Planococcus lenghuensis]|uniref:hypothetical protein n=1 Tax=Planococcus lenghuensis TaxID=2213202 RepID=UPI0012EBEAEC|nr:hypothetical protein [Planococcus lenghuensis]
MIKVASLLTGEMPLLYLPIGRCLPFNYDYFFFSMKMKKPSLELIGFTKDGFICIQLS